MLEKQAPIKTELEELESAIVKASLDITKDRPFKFVHGRRIISYHPCKMLASY